MSPDLILIFSGKRKSGKDYVCKKLSDYLQANSHLYHFTMITLSAPLKRLYANENSLDYEKLLDSSEYKEIYRLDMIK
jgi:phosphomevalonate kinase